MTTTSTTTLTLTAGTRYDRTDRIALTHTGWTDGDGTGHEGYRVDDYFDGTGRYQGADDHGIEPTFEESPIADLIRAVVSRGETFSGGSIAAEVAQDWADHDFDAATAAKWMDAGYWDASTAAEAREAGYTPSTELAYPEGHRLIESGMDPIYAACNNDIALDRLVVDDLPE